MAEHRPASSYLADWAEHQDGWIRGVVAAILTTQRPLGEAALDDSYERLLVEKGLAEQGDYHPHAPAYDPRPPAPAGDLRLRALGATSGVNRLVDNQSIEFNKSLTIIYGENAAGKTGYARILKSAANSRSASAVLGNVYGQTAAPPTATIEYVIGEKELTADWVGESISDLAGICVFDAPASALHVDEDLAYLYSPAEVSLFEYVHDALSAVKQRLDAARNERAPTGNPFTSRFRRGSPQFDAVSELRATSDLDLLRGLALREADEDDRIERLRERVQLLAAGADATSRSGLAARRDACDRALECIRVLKEFDSSSHAELSAAIERLQQEVHQLTNALFEGIELPGRATPEWEAFVRAGDAYVQQHDPPAPSETTCPYCRQSLDADAADLLSRYHRHLSHDLQAQLAQSARDRADLEQPVREVQLAGAPTTEEADAPWARAVDEIDVLVTALRNSFDGGPSDRAEGAEVERLRHIVAAERESTTLLLAQAAADEAERSQDLEACRGELVELEDRGTLAELIPDIERHVENARWADHAGAVLGNLPGVLRSLTDTSKQATAAILSTNFEEWFGEECALLRCPSVTLEFPGRQGTTRRHKFVGADTPLGVVLSEGEQKVIALADFLAETRLRESSGPIILDDPITSLDARRNDDVANRIVALSRQHQVIVFTHHLYFASKLLAAFEGADLRSDCSFYEVLAEDGQVGLVHRGNHPRTDGVAAVRRRVNAGLQEARTQSGRDRDDAIARTYGHVRTWIEALVEDVLLEGAVKRHRANISIDALARLDTSRLDRAREALQPIYDRACRRMWPHSQTFDALQARPTVDELEADWETLRAISEST